MNRLILKRLAVLYNILAHQFLNMGQTQWRWNPVKNWSYVREILFVPHLTLYRCLILSFKKLNIRTIWNYIKEHILLKFNFETDSFFFFSWNLFLKVTLNNWKKVSGTLYWTIENIAPTREGRDGNKTKRCEECNITHQFCFLKR